MILDSSSVIISSVVVIGCLMKGCDRFMCWFVLGFV